VTREGCHVDRTACAWLIQRYIDDDPTFLFVVDASDLPSDATAFDIAGQPFSHHGGDCTFEVMVRHYRLASPGLARLAQVVHEADVEDERYDAPEAAGLDAIIRGMGTGRTDTELLLAALPIYDGLLAHLGEGESLRGT
jgi:hypothetical protein